MFSTTGSVLVKEFTHNGIKGHVYSHHHQRTKQDSLNLIWLNPPTQRVAIYLDQTPENEYTPEFLINILKDMQEAR